MNEADIQREVMMELSRLGAVVWRNNTAIVTGWDTVKTAISLLKRGQISACISFLQSRRPITVGLCKGSSDIIGIYRGLFLAVEVKTPKGRVSADQQIFLDAVNRAGGIAFVARDKKDVKTMLTQLSR